MANLDKTRCSSVVRKRETPKRYSDTIRFAMTIIESLSFSTARRYPYRGVRIIGLRRAKSGRDVVTSSTDGIREIVAMKQEPEDEEDCFLDETSMPATSTTPPPPPSPSSALLPPQLPQSSSSSSSSGRHGNMTHRVRSHARSLRAMANPSAVWAHFDLCANDPLRAQCRICGAVVVRGGANPRQCGTTNLHRHLRVHHGGRLIGRRYHVLQSTSQGNTTAKTIRIATQSLVRPHIRNIAPAPLPQQQQQQQPRQPKTLVLKTIPLKVKQVAPTTIKMPPRQVNQGLPHNVVHQQPTEVCLRWNSYHSNMQNSFPSLLDTEQFVDVTLACEGRSLKCHKMILSSCSDYLADLLRENPCQHPIILMKDLKFWEVEALVKFMYRGEVNVAHDKLPQLLNAAEALQVKGLAGPSPSSQNTKPPLLIPQSKPLSSQLVVPRGIAESKENKRVSPARIPAPSSPKRAQKRQHSEPIEPRPFTKIRLQRPATPSSPCATVKMEPLDIPLSPTEIFSDGNEDVAPPSDFEKLMNLHEEDDPGGEEEEEVNDADERLHFCELPAPPDLNDNEDQMEFVPTDFLEQQQEIVEESESSCNKDDNKKESPDYASTDVGEDDRVAPSEMQPTKEKKTA
ncbi:Protein bric-a-brac [Ooceraea biroi]|uniref:Protein bric-a-brac n=1 Tax=Ooceraea biroi TaxID=2015173 RepID=A0A026WY13_OOCBI|nr:Protein bric-a-brac [Ooceraea biroi]